MTTGLGPSTYPVRRCPHTPGRRTVPHMCETIVERFGYRVRVRSFGPLDAPDALVLPGMGATSFTLAPQIRLLRRLGYRTHVVDLPGFGLSPALRQEDARLTQLAELVAGVCADLGIRRTLVLGHSLGGGIALHMALARRDLVSGLVLLAPAALGRSLVWTYKLFCLPLLGRALLQPSRHAAREYFRRFLVGRARRDEVKFINRLIRNDHQSPAKTRSMRAIVWANQPPRRWRVARLLLPGGEQNHFSVRRRVDALRGIPILVLWGSDDRVLAAHEAIAFAEADPDAEVHVVRGVGHMLPLEAPAWVNTHIARFDTQRLRPPTE